MMAKPLTKHKKTGERYARPPSIEENIDGALQESPPSLRKRLSVTDRESKEYLTTECLVHLVRHLTRSNEAELRNEVVLVLLGRCESILKRKVDASQVPNAEVLRDEILGEFALLLAADGTAEDPDELDYYECSFNHAFRTFRIDVMRTAEEEMSATVPIPTETRDSEDEVRPNTDIPRSRATQADDVDELDLLSRLPPDLRKAWVLCHKLGYEAESEEDPNKVTAATLCKVSGRTIRTRLKQAKGILSRLLEEEI